MLKLQKEKQHEQWVDYAKLFACILVVLGHLFQSFAKTNLIDGSSVVYNTFQHVIYLFHVPVFFFCSGYLYQKISPINSWSNYKKNVWNKFLNLGIPYFTFSIITLVLKSFASNSIVTPQEYSFLETLFLHPASPYWFLYTLFFIFVFIPSLYKKTISYICSLVIILKIISILLSNKIALPFCISSLMSNAVWFVLGMVVMKFNALSKTNCAITLISLLFIPLSILLYANNIKSPWISIMLTFLGITMTCLLFYKAKQIPKYLNVFLNYMSKYTMQIFLLHTICAASFRALLFKFDIQSFYIHLCFGILISFFLPIALAYIAEKSFYLDFFFRPVKVIKGKTK